VEQTAPDGLRAVDNRDVSDAFILPGAFSPFTPLTHYAGTVAEKRGATVLRHQWTEDVPDWQVPEIAEWVRAQASPLLDSTGGTPLLIGKSIGSNAAVLAAERSLPAVWLTPLLTFPWIVTALREAMAPCLLVGGSADKFWDGDAARALSPHVLEVDRADHSMDVPGPVVDSVVVLGRVVQAVEEFLATIGWPPNRG
jgi:hypothetical protein